MSDKNRLGLTDRAGAKLKPDSQKTTTEHLGDNVKGTTDSVASSVQPQSEKSITQKVGDMFHTSPSTHDNRSATGKTKGPLGLGGH